MKKVKGAQAWSVPASSSIVKPLLSRNLCGLGFFLCLLTFSLAWGIAAQLRGRLLRYLEECHGKRSKTITTSMWPGWSFPRWLPWYFFFSAASLFSGWQPGCWEEHKAAEKSGLLLDRAGPLFPFVAQGLHASWSLTTYFPPISLVMAVGATWQL